MVSSSCAALAFAATALTLVRQGHGHMMHLEPVSRQYSMTLDFIHWSNEDWEDLPFAYNAGGQLNILPRAVAETDPDVLAENGEGWMFPLHPNFSPLADNGNYVESNEIAKRHGACGDPRKPLPGEVDRSWKYTTPNSEWEVINTNHYTSGQVLVVDAVMEYYHAGHVEMRLCDIRDLEDPEGVVTQECLNTYQLDRAEDDGDASPIDPNYRGRYYVDPPCREFELEDLQQEAKQMHHTSKHYFFQMRYQLPDIECEHCVLQMHYLSGSRCMHVGYEEFNPPSWPGQCASEKDDWIVPKARVCGAGIPYPEEFWQCSDIKITRDATQTEGDQAVPETDDEAYEAEEEEYSFETPGDDYSYVPPADADSYTIGVGNNEDYIDLGCVADTRLERIMQMQDVPAEQEAKMTGKLCMAVCRDQGKMYSGTQYSAECFCGDEDTDHLTHGECDGEMCKCDYPCAGDENEICGGYWSMNVRELV